MKNIWNIFGASLLGSLLTAGVFYYFFKNEKIISLQQSGETPVIHASYEYPETPDFIPPDFTYAAERSTSAVVHIKSTTIHVARYNSQMPDPFRHFFGDEFFKRHFFFEPNQQKEVPVTGSGSGVIISEEGYILTNNHVIQGADDIEVTLYDKRNFKAELIGTDPSTDLALLKIDEKELPYLSFANSDKVKVGEWVMAVGNPFNLASTVTAGIVSAKGRNLNILKEKSAIESFIQTDAAINKGNSGGALVNLKGELIGINTAIASPTGSYAGYGFSVPSNIAKKVTEDLLEYGVVQRGYLGVMIRNIDGKLADKFKLGTTSGVFVDSIVKGSSADKAGLRKGDVILSINHVEVKAAPHLQELIARHRPGDEIWLKISRKGKVKEISVDLKNRIGTEEIIAEDHTKVMQLLSAEFEPVSKKELKEIGVEHGIRLKSIKPGKLKRHTQIKEGFILTHIDGQPVKSLKDITEILKNKSGGVMLEGRYPGVAGLFYYAIGI